MMILNEVIKKIDILREDIQHLIEFINTADCTDEFKLKQVKQQLEIIIYDYTKTKAD
jgi:hypothetical protein